MTTEFQKRPGCPQSWRNLTGQWIIIKDKEFLKFLSLLAYVLEKRWGRKISQDEPFTRFQYDLLSHALYEVMLVYL